MSAATDLRTRTICGMLIGWPHPWARFIVFAESGTTLT
jgi:hypothetical protein